MGNRLPDVVGLDDLLQINGPLGGKPAPFIYFTDGEFARLTRNIEKVPKLPRGVLPDFSLLPWPGGGMVQAACESPPGQVCFGRWTPAGPGRGAGVYFGCVCRTIDLIRPKVRALLKPACTLGIGPDRRLRCTGTCKSGCRIIMVVPKDHRQPVHIACVCDRP